MHKTVMLAVWFLLVIVLCCTLGCVDKMNTQLDASAKVAVRAESFANECAPYLFGLYPFGDSVPIGHTQLFEFITGSREGLTIITIDGKPHKFDSPPYVVEYVIPLKRSLDVEVFHKVRDGYSVLLTKRYTCLSTE